MTDPTRSPQEPPADREWDPGAEENEPVEGRTDNAEAQQRDRHLDEAQRVQVDRGRDFAEGDAHDDSAAAGDGL